MDTLILTSLLEDLVLVMALRGGEKQTTTHFGASPKEDAPIPGFEGPL